MSGTRIVVGALCAAAGVAAAGLVADEIVVGTGERHVFAVDAAAVQADAVRLSPRATLEKTGAGRLELSDGAFTENAPVEIDVREGTLALTASDSSVVWTQPADVMNRAAFWLESQTHLQSRVDGEDDEVESWLDVRETGTGDEANPYLYPRAVAFTNDWLTAFPTAKFYQEKPGVWFRGYGSGCFMNWVKPDGTQANVNGVRHAFVVHGGDTSRGDVLGQRPGNDPYFQRAGNSNIWVCHLGENAPLHASRTYLNGEQINPFAREYDVKSVHVVEVEALGGDLGAMCFFNDRDMQLKTTAGTNMAATAEGKKVNAVLGTTAWTGGGDRAGGEYVFEMLLFTNGLTGAERLAVSDWLNRKWRGAAPPERRPATAVRLAANTVVEVADAGVSFTMTGDGVLRKTGDGAMTVRPAFEPRNSSARVEVREGTLHLGYGLPLVCAAGDTFVCEQTRAGAVLSPPVAGTDKTRLVKEGGGTVTLDSIPSGVSKISVKAGGLRLASPERASRMVAATPVETAEIPDADFETYPATSHSHPYSYIADGQEANGWHAIVPPKNPGKNDSAVFFFDQRLGEPGGGWNMKFQDNPTGVLVVKNLASAWCEVVVPADGFYELTFRAAPRNGGYSGDQLDVQIGRDADSLVSFGGFTTAGTSAWLSYSLGPVRLSAGTHQLWLKSNGTDNDRCTQFDDFRLTRCQERPEWAIPNGDFEKRDAAFYNGFVLDNTNRVPGFTVGQQTTPSEYDTYNSASTFSPNGVDSYRHFNKPWNRPDSKTQFCMAGAGATLSTTFTPPAGTWRFRADFSLWCVSANSAKSYSIAANARIGEVDVPLGVVTNRSHALLPCDWPVAFTVDGGTPVTLTLTGGVGEEKEKNGHGIVDNLVLAAVWPTDGNLVRNGGFETKDAWTFVKTPKPDKVDGSAYLSYAGSFFTTYFGMDAIEGANCVRIVNDDTVFQSVSIPSAGLYRLSANLVSRWQSNDPNANLPYGRNPMAFYMAKDGVTNWLGRTDAIALTNFNEYAFLAHVSEAGVYDVGLKGQVVWGGADSATVDRTTLVDAVQLYRIETEAPLELPADLEIDLASDARLSLDFEGTNEIRRLAIGGRGRVGVVSAADCPELSSVLSGPGAFFIRPRGTMLILR